MRGRHALPGVGVEVSDAQSKLGQCAEQRHFLGHDLSCTEYSQAVCAVALLQPAKTRHKFRERATPLHGYKLVGVRISEARGEGPIMGCEWSQSLPTFGTSHALIDRVVRIGSQIDRLSPVVDMGKE